VSIITNYRYEIDRLLNRIVADEDHAMTAAAAEIVNRLMDDRLLHVFGPGGHSAMAAVEIFYRAGGLVPVSPILDPAIQLSRGAHASTEFERVAEHGSRLVDTYEVNSGDVLIVVNVAGINAMSVEAAAYARQKGVCVISLSSHEWSQSVPDDHPARHPSKQNLMDVSDIAIDMKVPPGDGVLHISGLLDPVGPISTQSMSFILQSIILRVIETMVHKNAHPPIWRSSNIPGGDEANKGQFAAYSARVRHL
jgi:uncharacterized phosphosugar-binding protein